MVRLFAAVSGLSVCLVAVLGTSPVAFGGVGGQIINGDSNGDIDRDISDPGCYPVWLLQRGSDPVNILSQKNLAARVAELEGLLSVANASLDTATADNASMAADLVTVRAGLEAADTALAKCLAGRDPVPVPGPEVEN